MRKTLCIMLICILLLFAFAGCSNTGTTDETQAAGEPEDTQTPAPSANEQQPSPAITEPSEETEASEASTEITQEQLDGIMYAIAHYLMYDVAIEDWPENRNFDENTTLSFDFFEEIFQNVIWMSYGTPGSYYYRYDSDKETFDLVDLSTAATFVGISDLPTTEDTLGLMKNHSADEGLGRGVFVLTEDAAKKAMYSMFGKERVDTAQFFETVMSYTNMEETRWYWYENGYFMIAGTRPYETGGAAELKTTDTAFEEGKEFTFSWKADLSSAYDGTEGIFVIETDVVVTLEPDSTSNYGYNFKTFTGDNPGMNAGAITDDE